MSASKTAGLRSTLFLTTASKVLAVVEPPSPAVRPKKKDLVHAGHVQSKGRQLLDNIVAERAAFSGQCLISATKQEVLHWWLMWAPTGVLDGWQNESGQRSKSYFCRANRPKCGTVVRKTLL